MLLRRHQFDRTRSSLRYGQIYHASLRQRLPEYLEFVADVGTQIGELAPLIGEDVHDIQVLVRMAARAMGVSARTWVDDGKVYFYIRRGDLSIS